eukprot:Gregarina_sp_Pseudo_9__3835@NODE_398_length_2924_cov_29_748007_g375_i0_p4_GENE_NODE_398_length_2924_cov_29_748007_g375_i0NODE_398_length_2924_cov_29_748007_g375_i0_p4_ORF_typecomplete_len149_score54_87_NODE_398_length_2924_cov_29_748007_g375_i09781424
MLSKNDQQRARIRDLAARFCAESRDEALPAAMSKGFQSPGSKQRPSLKAETETETPRKETETPRGETETAESRDAHLAAVQTRLRDVQMKCLIAIHQTALNQYIVDDVKNRLRALAAPPKSKELTTPHWTQWVDQHFYKSLLNNVGPQ